MPAYAATVHKSQGSEYPAVVIPVLAGQKKEAAIAVRNASGRRRRSKLDEWLAGAKDGPQARPLRGPPLTGAVP